MWEIDIFAALFCLLILIYACQSDIRKRSVSNIPWLVMVTAGIALLVPSIAAYGTSLLIQAAISFVFTLAITYLFFRLCLFGAADAKCLIAISVLFPTYPSFVILSHRLPLFSPAAPEVLPFALTTLMNAALLALIVPLSLSFRNLLDLGPGGFYRHLGMVFTGYQMPIAQLAKKRHVRLVHPFREEDGRLKKTFALSGVEIDDEIIKRLESYHREGKLGSKVWVTPELPFIVFITSGFLTAVLVGNLALALAVRG